MIWRSLSQSKVDVRKNKTYTNQVNLKNISKQYKRTKQIEKYEHKVTETILEISEWNNTEKTENGFSEYRHRPHPGGSVVSVSDS